jgi:Bacterial trigger factor protein (TF)
MLPVDAFMTPTTTSSSSSSLSSSVLPGRTAIRKNWAVDATADSSVFDLKPEPEGGEVLTPIKTLEGSRMKKMKSVDNIKSDNGNQVYEFWLTAKAEGALIKSIHSEVLKESAKKANFPGFRKGQVPPYAMPQIRGFAVSEAIVRTCQSAVDAYGLKSLSGSDGEVDVREDITEMNKSYKVGDDLYFTGTFKATFDQDVSTSSASSVTDAIDAVADVIDVETVSTDAGSD